MNTVANNAQKTSKFKFLQPPHSQRDPPSVHGEDDLGKEAFGDRRIKAGGALECRATGVFEKLGPLSILTLAVSFGRVIRSTERLAQSSCRSTPLDAGPTNARHHPKTLQARRRIRVQRNRHRVFRGQKGDPFKG
jgi:hypothetical protein